MLERIKYWSLVTIGLLAYTFVGGMMYQAIPHEREWSEEHEHYHNDAVMTSVVWPVALVVFGVGTAVKEVAGLGGQWYHEAVQ